MSTLLTIQELEKSYASRTIFSEVNFSVNKKQKYGVIGRNGAGKSTLLKMIIGTEEIDNGKITIHDNTRIGYVSQHESDEFLDAKVLDYLMDNTGKQDWECAKMAGNFEIKNEQLEQTIRTFSGGYRMRVKLIEMLLHDPNLLILDEPTNYLDLATVLLLEKFLISYKGSFLLVSHDREFLKKCCTHTMDIANKKVTLYNGGIEEYLAHKVRLEEFALRHNKNVEKERRHMQSFVDRFRYKASKASQAQSRIKQIAKLETIEIENVAKIALIDLPEVPQKKGVALHAFELAIGYKDKKVADNINFDIDRGEHVAIVGDNGQGKSTFLKTISKLIPPLSGTFRWGPKISVGYYAQHVTDMLRENITVETYLKNCAGGNVRDQEVLKMAGNFLFSGHDIKKPCGVLSGGEKARLCLAGMLLKRHDVLLLDEPTNHLDFETVEALALALKESNATIFFVSHNRTFVSQVSTSVIEVKNGKVVRSHHDYDNYVYHLREELDALERKETKIDTQSVLEKIRRKELHSKIKQEKKELQELEMHIMKLERKKQKLHKWFADNPTEYSDKKNKSYKDVEDALALSEKDWFGLQDKIQKLEEDL